VCSKNQLLVLGVEGFYLEGEARIPDLASIITCSNARSIQEEDWQSFVTQINDSTAKILGE
jgi:hypothetical protein